MMQWVRRCVAPVVAVGALLGVAACSDVSDQVTREFAVGQTFDIYPKDSLGRLNAFDVRAKVIAVGGQLELCGAMIVRDPNMRGTYETMLREARLLVDGQPVMRDLSFFNSGARSFAPFTTDTARCRAIGMAAPMRPIATELELNAHHFQGPE